MDDTSYADVAIRILDPSNLDRRDIHMGKAMEEVGRAVSEASRKQALEAGLLAEMAERVRAASVDIDAALSGQGTACSQAVELLDGIREKTRQSAEGLQAEVTGLLGENDGLRRAFQKFRT